MNIRSLQLVIIVFVGGLFLLYFFRAPLLSALDELKLLPRDERLTELYLNNIEKLPSAINAGQTVTFSFTIRNLEGTTVEYPYVVFMQQNGVTVATIDQSSVSLLDGEIKTIGQSYTFETTPETTVTVFIHLLDQNQTLHFILPQSD